MITPMESAIILAVPEAEELVGALRLEGDGSAALGIPAHVTLLYPFVDDPDDGVIEELRFFFAGVDAFPLTFSSVGTWPELIYLAMDEVSEVHGLISALARRWPAFPPYGGMFPLQELVPHLTVVDTPDAALRARAAAHLSPGLPVRSTAAEATLWVHEPQGWTRRATFTFAAGE